ncbi:MAG: twin-arginine translocation signal domain-containing protein, partial [Candidatus Woesebacteria bacterium]|nr:twin-arginine translocation signal domain-containing protein [Candidatus Woesebacteria bacterium]
MADKQEGISRRSFLKTIGAGIAGIVGYKVIEKFSNLEEKPTFQPINEGETIPLKLFGSEELTSIKITYREKDERLLGKLQSRKEDGK